MKQLSVFVMALVMVSSCKQSNKDLITKRWQAVAMESPMLDEQIRQERHFIDTVGTSTDAKTNEILYGVSNMDSMRQWMSGQMDSFITMQQQTVKNTWLHFYNDGTVATSFGSAPDTVSWYFEEDGSLILDEMKKKGAGSKIKMEVLKLERDSLKLRFNENGFSSTAIFIPEKL